MVRGKLLGGWLGALTVGGVAGLQLQAALADDGMLLGAVGDKLAEFQSQVGDRVFFSEASAELGARGRVALQAQAAWLARHAALGVIIEGHSDDAGAPGHNLEISQRRAEIVRRRLIQMGIAPRRVRTMAYGRQRRVADCPLPACAAQNRRVVTVIVPALVEGASAPLSGRAVARPSARRLN